MLERVKANIIRFVRNQEWMRAFVFLFEAMDTTMGVSITDGERYARDYLIDLFADGTLPIDLRLGTSNNIGVSRDFSMTLQGDQSGFLLDFEDWTTDSDYTTKYNITKDGFAIDAVGMVIGLDDLNSSPISGSRSFVLNGGQRFDTYVTISGLQGVGTVSMKVAPWKDGAGDRDATLIVSDGTTTRRFPIPPYADV